MRNCLLCKSFITLRKVNFLLESNYTTDKFSKTFLFEF